MAVERAQIGFKAPERRGRGKGRLHDYSASEAQIQDAIVRWLELRGYLFTVTDAERSWNRTGSIRRKRRITPGWPDVSLVLPGNGGARAVFIEVKSAKGRLSPQQLTCHARLRGLGALVIVARSLDDVIKGLS